MFTQGVVKVLSIVEKKIFEQKYLFLKTSDLTNPNLAT